MVFDEDQAKDRAGKTPADQDDSQQEDKRSGAERRRDVGGTVAAAGAAGTGLGVGAGAGVVGAGEAMDQLVDRDDDFDVDLTGIEEVEARIGAAEEAARAATIDVFESRMAGVDLPEGVADASLIVGDAVPTAPAPQGGPGIGQPPGDGLPPTNRSQPEDAVPLDGESPIPGSPPSIGRPNVDPELDASDEDAGASGPGAPAAPGGPQPPDAPEAPGAPAPPDFGGEPSFPSPPSGGPGAPAPPAAGPPGAAGEDAVIGEAPAPPSDEPSLDSPSIPAPGAPANEDQPIPPASADVPSDTPSDGVISESPSSPSITDDPRGPVESEPVPPGPSADLEEPVDSAPDSPAAPGESSDPAPPLDSAPSTPATPDAPSSPSTGSSGPGQSGSATYPYVSDWNAEGGWVDVMTQNNHGEVLHFRYDTDGSIYYFDEHGNYYPVEAEHLPTLLYVDEYGKAYFSVPHNGDTAYFSLDTYGERDWLHQNDIPGYGDEPVNGDYEYPRVIEYEYGDEGWALVQMEDGQLVKYYEEGGAYYVDEYGNETPINGFQAPNLLHVDHDGDAYFRVFSEQNGEYSYYMIDADGGLEYVNPEDIPGYDNDQDAYEYPRIIEYEYGDEGWAIVQYEDGRLIKYYADGGEYQVDEYGNESPVMIPEHLIYTDQYGNAYFYRYNVDGNDQYFTIDVDGGLEYIDPHDIPGYEVPDDYQPYEYPRTVQWDADEGWVIVHDGEGHYTQYFENGQVRYLDEHGNELQPNGYALHGELLYVDNYGNAYFRGGEEGDYSYFLIDHDGGIEYVDYADVPGYEPEEPDYDGHSPYFFDDYANPFYGDLEPDGEPIFANGFYTQIYNDGQVVVSYQQEGGPYRIRWISEDANGQDYIALDMTYDANNYEYDVHAYPYDYFDHVTEDFTVPEVDHYVDYAYLGIPPDSVEIAGHQVYYTWFDEDGDVSQRTRVNRDTGEVSYQYDGVVIYVDANGNQSYTGTPDPDWTPPDGYAPTEDFYPPYGMPPYMEFGDHQYFDPEGAGYELIGATPADDPTQWQYIGPNGERVIINKTDEYSYQFVYQPDPNAQPGTWEMVMNVTTDEYGNYVSYEAVEGTYYDEWYEDNPQQYDAQYVYDLLPDDLPVEFEGGYYNPEHGGGYEYHHSETYATQLLHFFEHDDGRTIVVRGNSNGTTSMYWYDRPIEEFGPSSPAVLEAHATIYPSGNYNFTYYEDGAVVDDPPVEEEEYETGLAEHYTPLYGYEHPYDLYGEPDEPGENQAPNVYLFGGGRAMVVVNEDGSETITWYSEGGYTDGYIEFKATAHWDGGAFASVETHVEPIDLIPNYGILPVNGTPIYDPYHPNAPWGEPDSVTILEDRVIAIWETDEGQIRSEWSRDGSGYREVRYPDGLVITGDGSDGWEYQVPLDWQAPEYDALDGYLPENAPDYFGDPMWANPEDDARFEFQYEGYPQGQGGPVTRTYHADVDHDGTADYIAVVTENPDGTYYVDYGYPNGDWQARVTLEANEFGNYTDHQIEYYADEPEGVPPYTNGVATPPEDDLAYAVYEAIPDNLPDYFHEERFPNPEEADDYEYAYSEGNVHYFVHEDGNQAIRVYANPNGNVTMAWHNVAPGEINASSQELVVEVQANGQWETTYYSDGPPPAGDEDDAEETNGEFVWQADGYLPEDGVPDYFVDERFPNPETDDRFEFYQQGNPGSGAITREYRADLDGDGQYDYRAIVVENPDGTVYVDYGYPNGDMEARITVSQDTYGAYTGYDSEYYVAAPVGAVHYEEPVEQQAVEEDYLPDWLPSSFDGYPSPTQEGFEYQYTGTGDGNQNHYYTNGQYTMMVTDYGDGTGRVMIDDLSNGQGWDTGYDLYDYGQYAVMEAYVPEEEEAAVEENYLPDWLPYSFDGYPSPVQEGFEYQYTGTGGGYENHFYTNGQYQIMVTDYGNGTGRVLIDDLSNGQGWDSGYDLYDYGQYTVMDEYASEMQNQIAFTEAPEETEEAAVDGTAAETGEDGEVTEDLEFSEDAAEAVELTEEEAVEEPLSFDGPETEAVVDEVETVIAEESAEEEALEVEIVAEFEAQPQPALVEDEPIVGGEDEAPLDDDDIDDGTGF